MKCPECHYINPSNITFCRKCGARLPLAKDISSLETEIFPASLRSLSKGSLFAGRYRIREVLGRGGMGIVYEVEDTKLKRHVALKFLPPELTRDPEAKRRFINEAQAASHLDYPNICTIHEIDETQEGEMYIVMACYKGESLREKIKRSPIRAEEVIDIAIQIAQGLDKAHQQGIIHRDIKPANLMITRDGIVKIVDFGLAILFGQIGEMGTIAKAGTMAYMSPEQIRGESLDQRTDIWSLGVVLYEMISGHLPFACEDHQAMAHSILNENPLPLKEQPSMLTLELEKIIGKALDKNPAKRFKSAGELAMALRNLKSKLASAPLSSVKQKLLRKRSVSLLIAVLGSFLMIAAILVLWISIHPGLAFGERDKLLVADVENQTGEAVFDVALRTAIEADLQQSSYVSIFDKGQVAETLRLMRRDPASRIDEELGCDICRFSGVRALILPRIISAGEAYELQAILIDPVRRRHVDRFRVSAFGREEVLLHGIDSLARQVRSRLGESIESIEQADAPITQVTTSSWEALQHLAMGKTKWQEGKFKEARTLFELALEKDPHFAIARGSLGLVLIQFLNEKEKGKEMLQQALDDAKDLPQREYLMIKAVNKQFVEEDLEGALDEYRMIADLYPDMWTPYNNSGLILRTLKRYDEAVIMFKKAADLASRSSIPLANLWYTYLNYMKDLRAAKETAQRLLDLGPEVPIFHSFFGWSLIAQGKYEEAIEAYRKVLTLEPQHEIGVSNLAHLLLATGKAREAIPLYKDMRKWTCHEQIPRTCAKASVSLAIALNEAGQLEEAKEVAAEGKNEILEEGKNMLQNVQDLLILAELEIMEGQAGQAKKNLNQALSIGIRDTYELMSLAETYALLGEKNLAIKTLARALESGYDDFFFPSIFPTFQLIRNEKQFKALFYMNRSSL